MAFKVRYQLKGAEVGNPDNARNLIEARQLAVDGRAIYGADLAIILSVDHDGKEAAVESIKL